MIKAISLFPVSLEYAIDEDNEMRMYAAFIASVIGFMADSFKLDRELTITLYLLLFATLFIMIGKNNSGGRREELTNRCIK